MEAAAFLAETGRARIGLFRKHLRRASADPASVELIHDLRVSIRRVLAWIAAWEGLLGPNRKFRESRSSLKKLMSPLGKLRDAHVKRDRIRELVPAGDDPSYLYAVLVGSDVLRWEGRVRGLLRRRSTTGIRIPVPKLRTGRVPARNDVDARAARMLADLAGEVVRHRDEALDPSNAEALHRMRLAFKKYRYAWELFAPLFPRAAKTTAKRLHAFQTVLGTIHDCDVILAEAASFRRGILGQEKECALETAFRAFREKSFGEFLKLHFRFAPPTRRW